MSITEKMWEAYGLMYQVEQAKKTEFVADWMHLTTTEVETLLADMKEQEPSLFPDISRDRIRPDRKTKRFGPMDELTAQKTAGMWDTISTTTELVDGLRRIADRNGVSCVQLAASWVATHPLADKAVIDALRAGQVAEPETVSGWSLSVEGIKEIERLVEETKE